MCGASKSAKKAADAVRGALYAIGAVKLHESVGTVGALYAIGSRASDCIYCLKTGMQLTLSHIPARLQEKHGLGESAIATFHESRAFDKDDVLSFGDGKRVQFREFADQDVTAYIGVKPADTDKTVADLLANAVARTGSTPAHESVSTGS